MKINVEINHVLETLSGMEPGTEEYRAAVEDLKILSEAKVKVRPIEPEVVLQVAANIIGIILVLQFEKLGVVSSKALLFLKRS